MSEDRHLLRRLRCGDKDALRRIYEKYRIDLFTVVVSLLHDAHVSEDCLQDVFVNLADSSRALNIRHNLKGYLISCVVNRARDKLRRRVTLSHRSLPESSYSSTPIDPAEELITNEESVRLFEALAELPYQQREAFVLHVQGEVKFRHIAKLQGVSIKTVQSRCRYATEKLRSALEKENRYEVSE